MSQVDNQTNNKRPCADSLMCSTWIKGKNKMTEMLCSLGRLLVIPPGWPLFI